MSNLQVSFTPGPWIVENDVQEKRILHFAVTARHADPDYFICSITPMRLKRSQDEANARLIATAPELLDALRVLYEETADYIRLNNLGDAHHNQSMKMAREAINKALNPQPKELL